MSKTVRVFIAMEGENAVVTARVKTGEVIGDLRKVIRPGEKLGEVPYAELAAAARDRGWMDVPAQQ
jgi:hypothetical protein